MNERVMQFRIGMFVIVAGLVLTMLIVWFGESQVLYDGPPEGLDDHNDPRVRQFVRGEAGERLRELAQQRGN